MKASSNAELDYLLVNIVQPPQKPNWQEAIQQRLNGSNRNAPWSWT